MEVGFMYFTYNSSLSKPLCVEEHFYRQIENVHLRRDRALRKAITSQMGYNHWLEIRWQPSEIYCGPFNPCRVWKGQNLRLLQYGINVSLWRWLDGTPKKYYPASWRSDLT